MSNCRTTGDNSKKVVNWHLVPPPTKNHFLHHDFIWTRHLFHNYSNKIPQLITRENHGRKQLFTKFWKLLAISCDGFFWLFLMPLLYLFSFHVQQRLLEPTPSQIEYFNLQGPYYAFLLLFSTPSVQFFYFCCLIDVMLVGSSKLLLRRVRPESNTWFLHPSPSPSDATVLSSSKLKLLRRFWETKTPDQYSLPSGHASRSMLIWVFILFWSREITPTLVSRYQVELPLVNLFVIGVFLWALLVGISRVCLGRHFMSDVLAGWCFGAFEALLGIWLREQLHLFHLKTTPLA